MSKGIFITATGTDVGKTYVTALLVKKLREGGLNAGYYKAALSGALRKGENLVPGDAAYVKQTAGISSPLSDMVSYVYEHAVSPHLASNIEGNPVTMEKVQQDYSHIASQYDYITVEGSGGIVCPLRTGETTIMLTDIIQMLNLKTLLVVHAGLGTIHQTVVTAAYARSLGIQIQGIIMNYYHPGDQMEEDNKIMIEQLTGLPVIACVEEGATDIGVSVPQLESLFS